MADRVEILITVRKEVANEAEARVAYATVKDKMAANPEWKITGNISTHIDPDA